VFDVAGNSILIVRQRDGSVKALHNACRHRATELARGCGRFPGEQIVCPFHGWRWNIDGSNSFVFMQDAFAPACLDPEDLQLRECLVEVWAGMVWINMDLEAPPLMDHLSPIVSTLHWEAVENMRVKWWKQVIVNANWKIAEEAFMESYHLMHTHPQLILGGDEEEEGVRHNEALDYTAYAHGHGRFSPNGKPVYDDMDFEKFLKLAHLISEGLDGIIEERDLHVMEALRNKIAPDDPTFIEQARSAVYEHAQGAGIPLVQPSEEIMKQAGGELFIFPHFLIVVNLGNAILHRSRPYNDDPEWSLFDTWTLTTYPAGEEPERAELTGVFDKDDDENWGLVVRQDFSNMERQQRGLHSRSIERTRLAYGMEKTISNMHQEIDRRIATRR
jgi:phenylpropionate dioxygenase-like ring-hydroxylating dioxygenase large terminal subunit